MAKTDSEPKTKDDLYYERNLLALAFIQARTEWDAVRGRPDPMCGYWPDTDDVNDEEWAVVWIDLPGYGQVGWHVPMEMAEASGLGKRDPDYDGYTTEEKNDRLRKYAYGIVPEKWRADRGGEDAP